MRLCRLFAIVVFGLLLFDGLQTAEGRKKRNRTKKVQELPECGYTSCPQSKPGMLNVHIVPHTHDDVGWLKTVDQYYYGSNARITPVAVQNILDSVVQELLRDPQRRFIYVESAFFFKWWREQTAELQQQVVQLVEQGRLEFIGGAWSMNDEATVHYQSTIDQFTWGLRRLNDTFGACGRPRVGWQIDPFGHSREQASLFAQMGYDGQFFGRLDYQDKRQRELTQSLEMVWQGSANLGRAADLFTGVLFYHYMAPPGFCFDVMCNDEPIVDGYRSPENNVDRRVDEFIRIVQNMSKHYMSNNVIVTMGEDFHYQDAGKWYRNLDKLIKYTNLRQANGSQVNLFYSTPSCYLKSLHDENLVWPTKQDDFFPYASDPHTYWSGYFTSRPTLKRFERQSNHFLQVCKQLSVFAPQVTSRSFDFHLNFMREQMGIMQHHDAVTGTEKQHVAEDYARRLMIGLRACGETVRNVLNQLTTGRRQPELRHGTDPEHESTSTRAHPPTNYDFQFDTCYGLNISQCAVSEQSDRFMVTVYNALAHSRAEYVRLPVGSASYEVRDYRDVVVDSVTVPIASDVRAIHYRKSSAAQELLFMASELPPLGYKSYFVTRLGGDRTTPTVIGRRQRHTLTTERLTSPQEPFEIGNQRVRLQFSAQGQLQSIVANGARAQLRQTFFYYEAAMGDNREFANRSSGAYIFRPNSTEQVLPVNSASVRVVRTALVEEVHQTMTDWLSQVIRVYRDDGHVEFEWLVGAIPIDDGLGKEIVTRFATDLESRGVFYTDSNGREMMRRVRNHRDTWNISIAEPIAANYFPVTARIALEDATRRLAVLNDRAQGGSSLVDGAIDLMIHRRLLLDDAFGVGEALNETAYGRGLVARGQHYLTFGSKTNARPNIQSQERFVQLAKLLPSWLFVSDASNHTYSEWRENYTNIYSGLTLSLPQNVNLLTLEPWRDDTILIRFEHILEKLEDPLAYSKPVTFNVRDVLHTWNIAEMRETTLAANQWIDRASRLQFHTEQADFGQTYEEISSIRFEDVSSLRYGRGRRRGAGKSEDAGEVDPLEVTLQPMQIRTFVIVLEQSG